MITAQRSPDGRKVYSYLRFSDPSQSLGDSERRQVEAANAWMARKGYTFDESLSDHGYSGFTGANRTKGALGRFLALVKKGVVPCGSILVVENIDRVGREGMVDAMQTIIFDLIGNGITLQTVGRSEMTYDRESLNGTAIYVLIGEIQRAHNESQRKSDLIREVREQERLRARSDGKTLAGKLPAWIKETDDGKRVVIPEAVKAIELIFKLKLEGLGGNGIAKELNKRGVWSPDKTRKPRKNSRPGSRPQTTGWQSAYVKKILKNPAVIGHYQPCRTADGGSSKRIPDGDIITDYFPEIVKPGVFYAVQELLKANKGTGGKRGRISNLFTQLAVCGYCGGALRISKTDGINRFGCDRARRGLKCPSQRKARAGIRCDECEQLILTNCKKLRPEQILPSDDERAKLCQTLRESLADIRAKIKQTNDGINTYVDRVGKEGIQSTIVELYETRIAELTERRKTLLADEIEKQQSLAKAEKDANTFGVWKQNLDSLMKALATGDMEVRLRIRTHLREIIDKIEVFAIGHRKLYDEDAANAALSAAMKIVPKLTSKNGRPVSSMGAALRLPEVREAHDGERLADDYYEAVSDVAHDVASSKQFGDFLSWVTERRLGKDGRFLRVHFKTGQIIDMVPEDSIASGSKLFETEDGKREWRHVTPSISRLWEEFSAKRAR